MAQKKIKSKKQQHHIPQKVVATKKIAAFELDKFLQKFQWHIVIGLTITGGCFRMYNLGFLSMWIDEFAHAMPAKDFALKGIVKFVDYNGILLTLPNMLLAKVFGLHDGLMRFPVALVNTLTIPLLFLFTRKISNLKIALIATALITFSQYFIFWGRVDRMYGFIPFFFVLLTYCFWKAFEDYDNLKNKYFYLLPMFFLLALSAHIQSFLFVFVAGFYCSFIFIENIFTSKNANRFYDKYAIFAYLNLIALLILFTPLADYIMRPIITKVIMARQADAILPNWNYLFDFWASEKWFSSANTYWQLLTHDFDYLFIAGVLGFVASFFINRKLGYLLTSGFVIIFLIMGFILTQPNLPKYISFAYPFYVVAAATFIYYMWQQFRMMKKIAANNRFYNVVALLLLLLIFIIGLPFKRDFEMVTSDHQGNQCPAQLGEIYYVDWKNAIDYIKKHYQKGDAIFVTNNYPPEYYADFDSYFFRQQHYEPSIRKFVLNDTDYVKYSGNSLAQVERVFNDYKRGWLLADYYFMNPLSDINATNFCMQNMLFLFDSLRDGSVQVYKWDKADTLKRPERAFAFEIGKPNNCIKVDWIDQTKPYIYTLPLNFIVTRMPSSPNTRITILAQGIDSGNEAVININEQGPIAIPYPQARDGDYQVVSFTVPTSLLKQNENTFRFGYNIDRQNNGDKNKNGVVFYNYYMSN